MSAHPKLDGWLASHPYLASIADVELLVDSAANAIPAPALPVPRWSEYAPEYEEGVPLLRSAASGLDATAPAEVLGRLAERLTEAPLPRALAAQLRPLREFLRRSPADRASVVEWALAGAPPEGAPPSPGLAAFLAWTVLRRIVSPVVAAFGAWRCEDRWSRGACPTCGAPPGMSHLETDGEVRQRHLVCGFCATRWRFKRLACPHCANEEASRLGILELGGADASLRIDYCDACHGYVKTYAGDGDASMFLADWTTLHLDVLAKQRGLRRAGASLYTV